MGSGLIEANIKGEILARENGNLKINANLMPGYNSQNVDKSINNQNKPQ